MVYNPSLRQIPRSQLAEVLPAQQEPSILVWLEGTGRLKPREPAEVVKEEADSEELSDLMGDSDKYDDDDLSLGGDDDD
ncbi:DUF3134 domain-containing protein [Leptolyngbya sp. PCC 6406]|uniref:DUF3134 domain-containing protein n=1 Tax=Leptolyngbya sp. PCC 6406 TaxID=1173264 RepID=UPI0002AD02CF|nr:DUF3134 domain-containing protein [Leptolyngbya sp. PCC 6406]